MGTSRGMKSHNISVEWASSFVKLRWFVKLQWMWSNFLYDTLMWSNFGLDMVKLSSDHPSSHCWVSCIMFCAGQVQEVMDEIGNPGIPLSVISKAAEMQLHYTVDKVILGNRWLRKATGIQPKFPYMIDTFERRYTLCHC